MTDEDLVRFAAAAILHYLQQHPDSADTAEGIHEWWIDWPGVPEPLLITCLALEQLGQENKIQQSGVANRRIWRLQAD
jgi:hypothetical protein